MRLDDAIRKRGFRRWYERQLYDGCAYLITGFLALIMMAVAVEVIEYRRSTGALLTLLFVGAAGGALCVFAWRQFTWLLFRAEHVAERAVCPGCRTYAKFTLDSAAEQPDAAIGWTLAVHCRTCGHSWQID